MKNKTVALALIAIAIILVLGGLILLSKPQTNQTQQTNQNIVSPTPPKGEQTQQTTQVKQIDLAISAPNNNAVVKSPTLTVKGKTSPKAEVFVNEIQTQADSKGNFSAQVILDEGENYLIVTVNDQDGNYAEEELTITYQVD